jgi:amidohydrolase
MISSELAETARRIVQGLLPEIRALRRDIHAEPELGFQEFRTREKIDRALEKCGLHTWPPLAGTDFIAELEGKSAGRIICLRADTDALPLTEKSGLPHASRYPGIMHACGHDGHTAVLVGAAKTLSSLREHLPVSVRFVFQPNEEGLEGGLKLISGGALKAVEAAYSLHAWPELPVGAFSVKAGPQFAIGGRIRITLYGKGAHGAKPEKARNPIPPAARIVCRLFDLHKKVSGEYGGVVTVCSVRSGHTDNVIPDTAIIEGTARYLEEKRTSELTRAVEEIVASETGGTGIVAETLFETRGIIPVLNTPDAVEKIRRLSDAFFPAGAFRLSEKPSMGMEDFAFYLKERQGAMFWLGMGEQSPPVHNPMFDFNDDALENGILMLVLLTLDYE